MGELSLAEWHASLADHFKALAHRRTESGWPVFALEHALTPGDVQQLERAVKTSLLAGSPSKKVYLPWVVYAAEFGYRYAGDEYWQSFGRETRGWNDRWREFIRDCFTQFARSYHGAKPEGAWARNFTIISWPITHGILPKDLQKQLARVLYEARYSLRPELFSSASALGKHLRASSHDASARFREFAENTLLLGQIAAALLVQEPGEDQLISSAALARLISDINEERASREWLREARSSAQRLSVRGLSTREAPSPTPALGNPVFRPGHQDAAAQARALGVEPRFSLRPGPAGRWDVALEVPDLAPLLRIAPHLRESLEKSQGRVAGSESRVIARGRLVRGGAQRFVLSSWPAPETPLITFDGATADLRLLLDSVFRIPPGDSWLFRVASDGQAHELKTRLVHPGGTYVLLQRRPIGSLTQGFEKVNVTCDGVHALCFQVPSRVDDHWEGLLSNLKLECAKTLRVWPAGPSPASWDEAGNAEWLIGDETMLGIDTDHAIQSLEVSVDGRPPQSFSVSVGADGGQLFVSLGCLGEGSHRATVQTSRRPGRHDELGGILDFRVRAPQSSGSGKSSQQAVLMSSFPTSPTLEDLWDNRLELQVRGPSGTRARCIVSLKERGSGPVLFRKQLAAQALPIEPAVWRSVFQNQFRKEKNAELAYDAAHQCCIEFDAGPAGSVELTVDREFTPLRWGVQSAGLTPIAKLFDDSGAADVTVALRDFRAPTASIALPYDRAISGLPVEFPGGLFVANSGGKSASAIIVPARKNLQLSQLAIVPVVPNVRRDMHSLAELVRVAAEWENARLKGSALGPLYQQRVIRSILAELFGVIGGERWARAERQYLGDESGALHELKGLISDHPAERSLGAAIAHDVGRLAREEPEGKVAHFARLACTYLHGLNPDPTPRNTAPFVASFVRRTAQVERGRELCAFALRAASSASSLLSSCEGNAESGLAQLLERPAVARAARFAVLELDRLTRTQGIDTGTTYNGWTW